MREADIASGPSSHLDCPRLVRAQARDRGAEWRRGLPPLTLEVFRKMGGHTFPPGGIQPSRRADTEHHSEATSMAP